VAEQPSLWDEEPSGEQLRDRGVALVDTTEDQWQVEADRALSYLLATKAPFTAADLTDLVGMPGHPNKVGAFIIGAARRGVIRPTGHYVKARRAASHARVMREWITA
jgi:hypothetical protein